MIVSSHDLGDMVLFVCFVAIMLWAFWSADKKDAERGEGRNVGAMPRGSIISCPNGHVLYRTTADITAGTPMKAEHVEGIGLPTPAPHTPIRTTCPHCQEPWRRRSVGRKMQTHFTAGWWPKVRS